MFILAGSDNISSKNIFQNIWRFANVILENGKVQIYKMFIKKTSKLLHTNSQ